MGLIDRIRRRRIVSRGWLPDEHDARDIDIDSLGLASARESPVSLRDMCSPVYDQGSTNSCVAQAFAGAIELRERLVTGKPSTTPSRLFMYANSRLAHGRLRFDFGTHLRLCAKMLNRLGAPDEKYWPFSYSHLVINRRPSWEASMRAHPRMGGIYARIFDTGQARTDAIKASLHGGWPVAFGTVVHESFLKRVGPDIVDMPSSRVDGAVAGGHAMLIVGYENHPRHGTLFVVRNSWGKYWRDSGYVCLTQKYVESVLTRDLWIVDGWRRLETA